MDNIWDNVNEKDRDKIIIAFKNATKISNNNRLYEEVRKACVEIKNVEHETFTKA